MLKIRAGWGAVVMAGLGLLMAIPVLAADDYWVMHTTQKADVNESFNDTRGITTANNAAGNLNNQFSSTTILLGGNGTGSAAANYFLHQGYAAFFIVGNAVFGQGVFSQDINSENNRVVVRQRTVGFLVDAQNTLGQVAIAHSFQGYTGVATVSQAAGNLNNQATMASILTGPTQSLASVHAGSPFQVYSNLSRNTLLLNDGSSYKAVIDGGSFRNYSGMLAISQTAGNLNNTSNYVGLSVNAGPETGQALDNKHLENVTALSKKNTNVIVGKGETPEVRVENGAFTNFTGVASIAQVAGSVNQVMTQVGVSVR